jgi:hypothetical protein
VAKDAKSGPPKSGEPSPVPKTGPAVDDGDTRIAPDPLAVVLPALSALGAVTSIAAVHWVAQERENGRPRPKRKVDVTLKDLESCCMGLKEIFRRLYANQKAFAGEGGHIAAPMKFGVNGPRVDAAALRGFHRLVNDTASMLVLACQNAVDVMAAVEDGEIDAPESVFFALGEQQERLNGLLQTRASIKTMVETGFEIAERLAQLVRELKAHRVEK